MNTATVMPAETIPIIREGWEVLVRQLGIQKATRFVILLERGKGDTIQEIEQYWGSRGIEEIYDRVTEWKAGAK